MTDDSDETVPLEPTTLDDEMDESRYEFPPGLMPEAEQTYSHLRGDGMTIVYTVGDLSSEFIKTNHTEKIER